MSKAIFSTSNNKGFHMTFENGVTISVQWGPGNYSDNYDEDFRPRERRNVDSSTAEMGIWDQQRIWLRFDDGDTVQGSLTPDQVSEWIYKVSRPDFEVRKYNLRGEKNETTI